MNDITIVIPVHNRRTLIGRTLDTIPDSFRVVLIDNGSSDGSYEECVRLASMRANTIVDREETIGAPAARNKGLALCSTEWVYFFDSDDEFTGLPDCWDEQKDMICFPVCQIVNGQKSVRAYRESASPEVHICNSMLSTQSMIFRTEWLRGIGGWNNDCRIWNDWELGLRALIHKPSLQWVTNGAFQNVIVHPDSITGTGYSQRLDRIINTMKVVADEIHAISDDVKMRRQCERALLLRAYIISGKLRNEGNNEAAMTLKQALMPHLYTSATYHLIGRMLELYTSKGGRAAWRVALSMV